jgi:hypothetical protein
VAKIENVATESFGAADDLVCLVEARDRVVVVEVHDRGARGGAEHLRRPVGRHLAPREAAAQRLGERDRRVEVGARDAAGDPHRQGHAEPPADGDESWSSAAARRALVAPSTPPAAASRSRCWRRATSPPAHRAAPAKLIHGGRRYLEQMEFGLVHEALRERGLLLNVIAPHLVRPVAFLLPLTRRIWERIYVGAGMLLYDELGGHKGMRRHRHLTKRKALQIAPALKPDSLIGALQYWDAQVDDLADEECDIQARQVINATGVWTDDLQHLVASAASSRSAPPRASTSSCREPQRHRLRPRARQQGARPPARPRGRRGRLRRAAPAAHRRVGGHEPAQPRAHRRGPGAGGDYIVELSLVSSGGSA